jgi:CRISPR/Cas system endoribonuclease Cas6 (RAMP superfamily)
LRDARSVWQSWLERWNGLCPPELQLAEEIPDIVCESVAVCRYALRTETTLYQGESGYQQIGFVGRVSYRIIRPRRLPVLRFGR